MIVCRDESMNQRHLVLFSTTPLLATSSQSTRARLLVPTSCMVGWFFGLPTRKHQHSSGHCLIYVPLSVARWAWIRNRFWHTLCSSAHRPYGSVALNILLMSYFPFSQPHLTDPYPQTSCETTKIVVICRTEETRDQDLLGHYKSSNK